MDRINIGMKNGSFFLCFLSFFVLKHENQSQYQEIIDFWGLDGPGGPKNHARRWGASPPTFWNDLWGRRGRPDPKIWRFPAGLVCIRADVALDSTRARLSHFRRANQGSGHPQPGFRPEPKFVYISVLRAKPLQKGGDGFGPRSDPVKPQV
jgi:hypothetical protein